MTQRHTTSVTSVTPKVLPTLIAAQATTFEYVMPVAFARNGDVFKLLVTNKAFEHGVGTRTFQNVKKSGFCISFFSCDALMRVFQQSSVHVYSPNRS